MRRAVLHVVLACGMFLVSSLAGARLALATTIVINNVDGVGEGFNDPTAVAPVGGNAGTTLGAQRLNVFEYAANIWASLLTSSVPIQVDAKFDPQQCSGGGALLGSAAPANAYFDFPGAGAASTFYPSAIADKQSGVDQDPGQPDILATFNSNVGSGGGCPFTFYLGLDGNAGSDIDLASVVLHELGHGLGFTTILAPNGGEPYDQGLDDNFAHWLEDHTLGLTMPNMTQAQRAAAQTNTGNLHFVGPQVRAASGILSAGAVGDHVRMYAPSPFEQGSSVAHWDTVLTPDQVMEPTYTSPNHDPGLALPLLCDVGWAPCSCGNGVLDLGEGCDDDGNISGDGCSSLCQEEECWTCSGAPSACTPLASGTPCNDNDGCTQTDECDNATTCVGTDPVTCTALDDCHVAGTCAPTTGLCSDPSAPDGTLCDDGDACTVSDTCSGGTCVGSPGCVGSFLCYKAKTNNAGGGFAPPAPQTLIDEYNEVVDFEVVKPKYLCTPADLNGTPPVDSATHLEGYSIKAVDGSPEHVAQTLQIVTNDLISPASSIVVDTVKPAFLLVPTNKSLVSDPSPPSGSIEIDHYKCYKIKIHKGTPKFPKGVLATIGDQFINPDQTFEKVKPSHLCLPVDKEGEGIKHVGIYQLCYSVKPIVTNPKHEGLYTHSQFGPERLDATTPARLCVASNKTSAPAGPLIHNYQLNGSFADLFGGPAMSSGGGALGTTEYTFAAGQGPSLSGAVPVSHYSIEMRFVISDTTNFRKLIDFKNRSADAGLYNNNTALNLYPLALGPPAAITAGVPVTVVLTRDDTTDTVNGYVDGVLQFSVSDPGGLATFTASGAIAQFMRDDPITSGVEQSAGSMDYVKIYDAPIVP